MNVKIPMINSSSPVCVEVHLTERSNVFLVDENNYKKYKKGQKFRYYGGYYKKTPVIITTDKSGTFYLIVDHGSYSYRCL